MCVSLLAVLAHPRPPHHALTPPAQVDVWAAGVMLFVMLMGAFPFEMEDENYETTQGA